MELNGWGDDLVHDYLRGVEVGGRLGVIYSNKDYGCEWDYDWRNKRFQREDNTKFAVNLVAYALTALRRGSPAPARRFRHPWRAGPPPAARRR